MKKKVMLMLMLAFVQVSMAQTQTCVDQVRKVYELLEKKVADVNAQHPFEMKFTLDITYSKYQGVDSTSYDAHVVSDHSKRYFFSGDHNVYQNEKVTISVARKQQEIHLFDTPPEEYKAVVTEKYAFFEDTLFSVVDRAAYVGKNQIVFEFKKENKVAGGIKEIIFNLAGDQIVESIQTNYYEGYPYKSIRAIYHMIDFDSKTALLEKEIMANIMNGGQLISAYKNYTLYDHRKNK